MKKIILFVLSLSILCLSCSALAESGEYVMGLLEPVGGDVNELNASAFDHLVEEHGAAPMSCVVKGYPNLNAALMDLYAGRIQILNAPEFCTQYIVSRNEGLVANSPQYTTYMGYSMMTMEEDIEIYDLLNDAIIELKENGTIEALYQEHIVKCCEGEEPATITLPVIEGAETIAVAITGDVPPMDYIAANGSPAGFNLALLVEISELAQINIEVVTVESPARATALANGKVDAVFWVGSNFCPDESHDYYVTETVQNTLLTEIYLESPTAYVMKMP